ncbi:MAG: Eco57I restriction-modification methylase domain-containing protein [Ruminococcus flavefaciens]|nr:Eco57I restriction-modification methylase domain-containing protein [Ruminococcus flavefaciens]
MANRFEDSFSYKLIYIFRINDRSHRGLLKIGDATLKTSDPVDKLPPNCAKLNQAAKERIDSYTRTAGVVYELLYTEIAVRTNLKNGAVMAFRDHDVQAALTNSLIEKVVIKGTNAREWFRVDLNTAIHAINAVKHFRPSLSPSEKSDVFTPVELRPEQLEAINATVKEFKKGNKMLWNAKMRFGKTLSALEVVRQMKFAKTIIVTHRPVVNKGWYEDFDKIFYREKDILYGSKNNGYTFEKLLESGNRFIYFASIQDLRGSEQVGGKHKKNSNVFSTPWDCVIVDEAHEGTTTSLGEEVINNIVNADTKLLALSGTPFNILGNYDKNVYTWDYIMEQRCKAEWDKEHFGDSNPYDELPKMNIYVYDLGKLLGNRYVELEDKAFNFHEFFRVWAGDIRYDYQSMPFGANVGEFVHKDDVLSFLNLITKEDENSQYPYSSTEYRDLFKHSLWIVPGVREAKALENLMNHHEIFGLFKIVNVAGDGDKNEEARDALTKVTEALEEAGDDGYTITLSCGKLTTGVTVKEWNAVFMLAGSFSTSASSYLQTIFRVQSPCNKNGKFKDNCYVFDFAPDRTLKMIAESVALSTKAGKTTESERRIMGEFLNYCPVISIEGTSMRKYEINRLLQQLKRAYADRAVNNGFDDTNLYNDELLKLSEVDLKKFDKLKGIIGSSKAQKEINDISINNQGFTDEEYEEIQKINNKPKRERTPEEQAKINEAEEKKKQRNNAISILRSISIRMPLLIYGTDIAFEEDFTIDKFLDDSIIDEASWNEFMPEGVTKDIFKVFMKYYDQDIFVSAGRKIRNIVKGADELAPMERVKQIAQLFACFKNPDKEKVLTPWRVVNMHMSDCLGGYSFYEENPPVNANMLEQPKFVDRGQVTKDTFGNINTQILEINSKTGLYPLYVAYSIFRTRCADYSESELTLDKQNEFWEKTVCENIFVLCNTPMAKHITKRTLVGYRDVFINVHYLDDMINMMKTNQEQFVSKVLESSYWNRSDDKMTFDAVIGNPPYQLETGGSKRQAKPVYNLFVESGKKLNPSYLSMIMPSRWFAGGMGLNEFRDSMTNDSSVERLIDYTNAKDCFPQISISGGICYFVWNSSYNGDCNITNIINGNSNTTSRPLNEFPILVRYNSAVSILHKVMKDGFVSIDTIISPLMPFGLSTKYRGKANRDANKNITLYSSEDITYISKDEIKKGLEYLPSYKVMISKMSAEHAGEPNKDGMFNVITKSTRVIMPNEVCTHSYFLIGNYNNKTEADNTLLYLKTRFVRFLIMMSLSAVNLSKLVFGFVPIQDYTSAADIDWSKSISEIDKQLYTKYGLDEDEIAFIEGMIRTMN